ncbi:unnamed protein product [Notodromas monacha]|uniref:Kazal-like domain-containing protein n=1 Tax=Notodromas monacha TaxID=399045 RepID=A0A7R9BH29_9CRUS|nr:unnamed protein product [Notodromas monacha]CAG0914280.1 unnamed protein product [Notodromas monacha]
MSKHTAAVICTLVLTVLAVTCIQESSTSQPTEPGSNARVCWDGRGKFQSADKYPDCPMSREFLPVCGTDGLCYPNGKALKCTNKHLSSTGQTTEYGKNLQKLRSVNPFEMAAGDPILRRNTPGTPNAVRSTSFCGEQLGMHFQSVCGIIFSSQDWCRWPHKAYEDLESTLAVQEFIQQTIREDPSNIDLILTAPENVDEGVWKYEHLRQFCMELNGLTVRLQDDCTPQTCNQMTATEQWIFLCAAHKTPKECPAIDYTRHTLDGAACLLNSNKYFPSRISIKESSVSKLGSVCRRVYRIFSHAYFHHRTIFDDYEAQTHLCKRFTLYVTRYCLMSKDNLIVPILENAASDLGGESAA